MSMGRTFGMYVRVSNSRCHMKYFVYTYIHAGGREKDSEKERLQRDPKKNWNRAYS